MVSIPPAWEAASEKTCSMEPPMTQRRAEDQATDGTDDTDVTSGETGLRPAGERSGEEKPESYWTT
jgi:hypothetical protein